MAVFAQTKSMKPIWRPIRAQRPRASAFLRVIDPPRECYFALLRCLLPGNTLPVRPRLGPMTHARRA